MDLMESFSGVACRPRPTGDGWFTRHLLGQLIGHFPSRVGVMRALYPHSLGLSRGYACQFVHSFYLIAPCCDDSLRSRSWLAHPAADPVHPPKRPSYILASAK